MARTYHSHQVTLTDGIYSHKISVNHKSGYGRLEHDMEIDSYKKEMFLWTRARLKIKELRGTARKYRKTIYIGEAVSLLTLFLMLQAIPGVPIITDWDGNNLTDIYCGDICEVKYMACSEFYKIVYRGQMPVYLESPDRAIIVHYEDEFGDLVESLTIPLGGCVKQKAVILKDEMDSLKFGVQIGLTDIDPYLISEVNTVNSRDRDNLDGTRNIELGIVLVKEKGTWKTLDKAKSLMKAEKTPYHINYLEKDDNWDVVIHDFNLTRINLTVNSKDSNVKVTLNGDIPREFKIKTGNHEIYVDDIFKYNSITFGDASTTVSFTTDANSAYLYDSNCDGVYSAGFSGSNINVFAGTTTSGSGREYRGYLSYNTSSLSGLSLESATLQLGAGLNSLESAEGILLYSCFYGEDEQSAATWGIGLGDFLSVAGHDTTPIDVHVTHNIGTGYINQTGLTQFCLQMNFTCHDESDVMVFELQNYAGYLNVTYTTTDTCDCPDSGDWAMTGSDNCVLSQDCDLLGNNFTCSGSGEFTMNANITNLIYYEFNTGCNFTCSGGCFI